MDRNLPEVTVQTENDFADLALSLVSFERSADGMVHVQALGQYQGQIVGFGASLGAEWEPQLLESSDITLYWGQASIYSLGSISDGFVSLLNAVYGLGLSVHSMREHTKCLAVGLRSDPRELPSRPISMKLMFEHDEEERYAECYLNIDVEGQRVEFNEKDQDYRVPLLQCLSGVP